MYMNVQATVCSLHTAPQLFKSLLNQDRTRERQILQQNNSRKKELTDKVGCSPDLRSFDALTDRPVNHIYSIWQMYCSLRLQLCSVRSWLQACRWQAGEKDENQTQTNSQPTGKDLHLPDNEKHPPLTCINFEILVVCHMKLNLMFIYIQEKKYSQLFSIYQKYTS